MHLRTIVFVGILLALVSGCKSDVDKRNPKYGGTLRINASDVPDIIFPGQVLKLSEQLIINQVYVGLVKNNPGTLDIDASFAKYWRAEHNQTLFTFYLNTSAYFHKDICFSNNGKKRVPRKITANDVKYSIEQIAKFHVLSQHEISSQLKNIKGADKFITSVFNSDSAHIDGIIVKNDSTIIFELNNSDPLFLHYLSSTNAKIFPKEAFNKYGFKSTVGSGAYYFKYPDIKGHAIVLVANNDFFRCNRQKERLPFIDTIIVSFITSPPKELLMFEEGKLDMVIGVHGDYVVDFLDKHIDEFQSNPPYYTMKEVTGDNGEVMYSFLRSNIRDMEINTINYFDLTSVYFKEPEVKEIVTD